MDLLVKKVSALSDDEKIVLDVVGLPDDWPIESCLYSENDPIPFNFEVMSDSALEQLKSDNQEAYDAWWAQRHGEQQAQQEAQNALRLRVKWGQHVIEQFRLLTIVSEVPDNISMPLVEMFAGVKSCLELGMLAAAADALSNLPANDLLDSPYDETRTVKQRFSDMILNEGPTP